MEWAAYVNEWGLEIHSAVTETGLVLKVFDWSMFPEFQPYDWMVIGDTGLLEGGFASSLEEGKAEAKKWAAVVVHDVVAFQKSHKESE